MIFHSYVTVITRGYPQSSPGFWGFHGIHPRENPEIDQREFEGPEYNFYFSILIGNVITPIDEL